MIEPRLLFAEHGRIVAKVDDLMALCDRLEGSLATVEYFPAPVGSLLAETLAPGKEVMPVEAARFATHG